MNAQEIIKFTAEWYTLGASIIPTLGTPQFATMVGGSATFPYAVNGDEDRIPVRLTDKTVIGYVDLKKKVIFVGTNLFNPELYATRFGEQESYEKLAIAAINGTVVHEALHIKHTPQPPRWSDDGEITAILLNHLAHGEYNKAVDKFGSDNLCRSFNIIEDIYIESMVQSNLEKWIQVMSDIFFTREDLAKFVDECSTNMNTYLNMATAFKNKEIRDDEAFAAMPEEAMKVLNSVAEKSIGMFASSRAAAAVDLLEAFPHELEEGEGESGEGESGEAEEGEEGEAGEGESTETTDSEEDANKERFTPALTDETAEDIDELDEMSEEDFDSFSDEIEEESDKITEKEADEQEYGSEEFGKVSWRRLVEKDVMTIRARGYTTIRPTNSTNFSFLKEIVAIRTLNRTPGQARTSGTVMVKSRLTRIATDMKIFANQDNERRTIKRLEVIINVDFSGSTTGTIINNELGAAYEMSKVLRSAGIAHSVYGHTSFSGDAGRQTPLLVHIFSHDMKTTNADQKERFERARFIELKENLDGVVIEHLTTKFTGREATRQIIILSDGSPAAPSYYGREANRHTTEKIAAARAKGIFVWSMSVVSHVVELNDRLYGAENNINASGNVAAQFRRLIKRLVD